MFQIEKNVPMPDLKKYTQGATKYPWREMQVGDSFVTSKKIGHFRVQALDAARRIGGGVKFACRKTDDGNTRVWRVA